MITQIEWAQLAAYVDGEGYISLTRKSRKEGKWAWHTFDISVRVANTDVRLPNWCQQRFGGSVQMTYAKQYRGRKSLYTWSVYGKKTKEILQGIAPYSVIKREQIEIGLAYIETMSKTKNVYTKGKYVPEEIRTQRNNLFEQMQKLRTLDFVDEKMKSNESVN
jgi:hypothetical protein